MTKIPLFKSHYSIGKSILTLEYRSKEQRKPENRDSIIEICEESGINNAFVIDDHIGGILEATQSAKKAKIDLRYGLKLCIVDDINEKSDKTKRKLWKGIVLLKHPDGYKNLMKISSKASVDGFYYSPRIDMENIKALWDEKTLKFALPFYDSFLFENLFNFGGYMPSFDFADPIFFTEDNGLIYDDILRAKVKTYCSTNGYKHYDAQTICYNKRRDFKAYLTNRCIYERTKIQRPNLDMMMSDNFCVESL